MKTKLLLFLTVLTLSLSSWAQQISQPEMFMLVRTNFAVPVIGEDGFPTGQITRQDYVVATWQAIEFDAGWDVMWRTNGIWLKPSVVFNGRDRNTGILRKSIFLTYREDYHTAYNFLWIVTINPLAQ